MSEVLSNFIQKFKDKKHYDFCLISAYPLAWLIVAYVGISELISLFSNNRLGLLEALLFTQIDLLSFKRSGIEILQNNSWRSVDSDTLLNDFRYWYNIIWIGVWGLSFRFLISKPVKTLVRNTDVNKVTQSYKLIYLNIRAIFKKTFSSFSNYLKTERENLKRIEGIKTSPNYYSRQDDNEKSIEYSWTGEREKTLEESDTPEFKECPYCCEQILYRAIKCKHCGSELEPTPEAKQVSANTTNVDSKTNNDEFTWKHFAGIGFVIALLYAIASGGSSTSSKISKENAKSLCRSYIAQQMGRPSSIIRTQHIKYDGGHFVKAYYYRPSDGDYFEYVCSLDNNTIVWAGVFDGNDIGRWRYEDEMNYKKNESGYWVLY